MGSSLTILANSFLQAFSELRANKLRSLLSLLGITFGIFCIILVLSVVDSLKSNIQTTFSSLGSSVLYVDRWPWFSPDGELKWWVYLRRPSMTENDLRAVSKLKGVSTSTLFVRTSLSTVKYLDQSVQDADVFAVTSDFDKAQNINVQDGRYLTESEIAGGNQSVVLGNTLAHELFTGTAAVGKTLTMYGKKFEVVGVLAAEDQNMSGMGYNNSLIFPYSTATGVMATTSLSLDPTLMIQAQRGFPVEQLKDEVIGALRIARRVAPGVADDFSVNQLSQLAGVIDSVLGQVNHVGVFIAIFSLLIGCFGVANIMFVTVKERTKFIGLKKAIGARPSVILREFLAEAVALCLVGGLVGIVLVVLTTKAISGIMPFPVALSLKNFLVGISISVVTGVLAGFLPARSAAALDPVVAIRSI